MQNPYSAIIYSLDCTTTTYYNPHVKCIDFSINATPQKGFMTICFTTACLFKVHTVHIGILHIENFLTMFWKTNCSFSIGLSKRYVSDVGLVKKV